MLEVCLDVMVDHSEGLTELGGSWSYLPPSNIGEHFTVTVRTEAGLSPADDPEIQLSADCRRAP
jgi:hypothetical protein